MDPRHKLDVANYLLGLGPILIHLDSRPHDVVCPQWLRKPQLVLQVGFSLPIPIPDLRVDSQGIHGTLTFKAAPFRCFCPWGAIFAIEGRDGCRQFWWDSVPSEIAQEIRNYQNAPAPAAINAAAPASPAPVQPARTAKRSKSLPPGWRVIK
jgi:hypothetical protein